MYWITVTLLVAISGAQAQLTALSSIAPELRECYMDTTLVNRNNLPPTTMPVLIDVIRKIEDHPNINMDLRQIAVTLLHTYRQDGIEYHQSEQLASSNILPYAPTFHSFHRHRLLLSRLIPGNLQVFANNTLSSQLKCGLHNMISTTIDTRVRGDENNCNQFSQYRAQRTARHVSIKDDVEMIDLSKLKVTDKNGQLRNYDPNNDVESSGVGGSMSERQLQGDSTCPILRGVVNTPWGPVSAGHVIAGIAAAAEAQTVDITRLTKDTALNYPNIQSTVTSIFPATLSGDLAEAVLIQGTERGARTISIGAAGNWNSTQATRYFMLNNRINVEMTDPEIRGDIDGFVLGSNYNSIIGTYISLKLSQLLDMYYSPRNGVFDSELRACNRHALAQRHIINNNLISETYTFTAVLDSNMPLRGTITGGLDLLVTSAVNNFQTYSTNNLNDLSCITSEATNRGFRSKTNLYLVIDSTWQFETVYPAISYILDMIEVGKYGSSVTLLNAFDGSIVINKTFSLSDFHSEYTLQRHQTIFSGVNLQTTMTNIRTLMHQELQNERTINYVGGNSTVLLFLLNSGTIQNNDATTEQARIIHTTAPDLRIIFATPSNQRDNLWSLVREPQTDIITVALSNDQSTANVMGAVVNRILTAGRRVINPVCGHDYPREAVSGSRHFDDFVEPGYVNFYSISPNYFFGQNSNRRLRVARVSTGTGNLVICHSRSITQPRQNSTISGVNDDSVSCQTLTTGNFEIGLQDPCYGQPFISSCPFFYFSVESVTTSNVTSLTCTDNHACRFPYDIRYQVQIEDFGCFSSAGKIVTSLSITIFALFLHILRMR